MPKTPKIQVKCSVDNCSYNKESMCYADTIKVDTMGDNFANTCDGTCCATFENTSK